MMGDPAGPVDLVEEPILALVAVVLDATGAPVAGVTVTFTTPAGTKVLQTSGKQTGLIFDTQDITQGPICRIELPFMLGWTPHGHWMDFRQQPGHQAVS